nr:formin-2-like [Chelonoidis abingdonii]
MQPPLGWGVAAAQRASIVQEGEWALYQIDAAGLGTSGIWPGGGGQAPAPVKSQQPRPPGVDIPPPPPAAPHPELWLQSFCLPPRCLVGEELEPSGEHSQAPPGMDLSPPPPVLPAQCSPQALGGGILKPQAAPSAGAAHGEDRLPLRSCQLDRLWLPGFPSIGLAVTPAQRPGILLASTHCPMSRRGRGPRKGLPCPHLLQPALFPLGQAQPPGHLPRLSAPTMCSGCSQPRLGTAWGRQACPCGCCREPFPTSPLSRVPRGGRLRLSEQPHMAGRAQLLSKAHTSCGHHLSLAPKPIIWGGS